MSLPLPAELLLAACMFLGAALYTSVEHAGASSYLALTALFGVSVATMRPTALVLNVLVASLASWRYLRAGLFRWRVLWSVPLGAVPMAFLGGAVRLPGHLYRPLVGAVLLLAAARLLWLTPVRAVREARNPPALPAALAGAGIRLDGHRRRHLPLAPAAVPRLVRGAARLQGGGGVHPVQLGRGLGGQPRLGRPFAARSAPVRRGGDARALPRHAAAPRSYQPRVRRTM